MTGNVIVIDHYQKKKVAVLSTDSSSVRSIAFSPSGKHFVTATMNASIAVWSTDARIVVGVLGAHIGSVNRCAFSSDGAYLASVSDDRKINGE
jgi:WD40 repeat protein